MSADDDGGVGVRKQLCTGQQVVCRCGEGVFVSLPVHRLAHELLGCRVGNGSNCHVGCGESVGVIEWAGDAEVGEVDIRVVCVEVSDQDVGRFDVAMEQPLLWA